MEQYLLRRKRNGQFSDKGRVVKLPKNWGKMKVKVDGKTKFVDFDEWTGTATLNSSRYGLVKKSYWDTFNWYRLFLLALGFTLIVYLVRGL